MRQAAATGAQRVLWTRTHVVVSLLAFLFAFTVRLAHLSDAGMWEDEVFRFDLARGDTTHFFASQTRELVPFTNDAASSHFIASMQEMLSFLRTYSPYPPAYYIILHLLMRAGFVDVAHLAVLNALAGGVVAFCLFLIARRRLSLAGACVTAILSALSPWDIGVCMQLKETGLAVALCVVSTTVLLYALETNSWKLWLISGGTLGIAVLTHHQAAFWGVTQVVVVASQYKRYSHVLPRALISWIFGAALSLPWAIYAGHDQFEHLRNFGKGFGADDGGAWAGIVEQITRSLGWSLAPLGPELLRWPALLLALLAGVFVFTVWSLIETCRDHRVSETRELAALGGTIWLVGLLLGVVLFPFMKQVLMPRYAPLFLPGAWLVVGAAIDWLSSRLLGRKGWAQFIQIIVGLTIGLVLLPNPLAPLPLDRYTDWREIATALEPRAAKDDVIVHLPGATDFDAFIHEWSKSTRHLSISVTTPTAIERVTELAGSHQIWLVLAWGRTTEKERWSKALADLGWVEVSPPIFISIPQMQRFEAVPPLARVLLDVVEVVGFRPNPQNP